jgi:hypothetical protein
MPRPKRKAVEAPEVVIPVLEEPTLPVVEERKPVETVYTADTKPVEVPKAPANVPTGRVTLRCQ